MCLYKKNLYLAFAFMATAIFYPPVYALYMLRLVDLQELFTSTVLHLNLSGVLSFHLRLVWSYVGCAWSFHPEVSLLSPNFSLGRRHHSEHK